jgi:hypothetical protein
VAANWESAGFINGIRKMGFEYRIADDCRLPMMMMIADELKFSGFETGGRRPPKLF